MSAHVTYFIGFGRILFYGVYARGASGGGLEGYMALRGVVGRVLGAGNREFRTGVAFRLPDDPLCKASGTAAVGYFNAVVAWMHRAHVGTIDAAS